ncbi:ead/Ea22-like family protein [Klebsiella pneumoniae]|uniref:ead/Ea22-like family protein n=1 Tax=Klebsiella pneumoniae complex TaxID=3390273 RepID=UPI00146399C2|nr:MULTISPECIES: ead/Ea22-like family protein [Klebsiella]QJL44003.1 ead/Ea22-like family protein [Klebsiella pneumoniae]QLT69765.1 ead/Ea22-like family protein [Klebsiella pneumoniae]HBQ1523849.1 ead/Ea22-like family protein [Klebsiella pneumoniae]HBU9673142.1 ead/Ea22-like family protein [Klebsiella pneumoniae]HBV4517086.1 ead/Ea22-like family protein [Klebsiella pneumoniae]
MTTDITELAQRIKAAAEKATPGEWVYFPKNTSIEYDVGSDESQGSILYVDSGDFTQVQTDRNGEFIALANPVNVLALVEALEKAQTINAAAEKLVRCKGRYHSEQNYRALAALFGVKTPDLPPLDSESRTATAAAADVLAERKRQVTAEGWTPGHDDEYEHGELADAAGCYALSSELFDCAGEPPRPWPWPDEWWKPTNRRRDLVKAGALILAEIERLDRAAGIKVEAE